jgi:hypothetical protein
LKLCAKSKIQDLASGHLAMPAGAIGVLWKSARSAATTIAILLLANVVVLTVEGSIPVKVVLIKWHWLLSTWGYLLPA